jgi:hypothetical protein
VTLRNVKNPSIDWKEIRRRFEEEPCHVRALAREHKTTDTRIRRRVKAEQWKPFVPTRALQRSKPVLQRAALCTIENNEIWAFEPRRDALIAGLKRVRNVDNPEDAIYSDLPVVMSLLWFRTPLPEIAKALQMTEPKLEELWGGPIFDFIEKYYGGRKRRNRAA